MNLTELEKNVLHKLPVRIFDAIKHVITLNPGILQEIRLRVNQYTAVTINGKNIQLTAKCTNQELSETLAILCENSLYSHSETIRDGYICAEGGIRVGVCGRAIIEMGRISAVRDLQYICIRIPHRFPGAADNLFGIMGNNNFANHVLIYGKPGSGKTTILRELILKLSECSSPKKVAVVDTRFELTSGLPLKGMVDVLSGYPRSSGIIMAVQTLSPEYIICDEIITAEDVSAVKTCIGSGVYICTSVHGNSLEDVKQNRNISDICNQFGIFYETTL